MTDKIKNILEQMTIEEKATMVCGASNFSTAAVPLSVVYRRSVCWMAERELIMNS